MPKIRELMKESWLPAWRSATASTSLSPRWGSTTTAKARKRCASSLRRTWIRSSRTRRRRCYRGRADCPLQLCTAGRRRRQGCRGQGALASRLRTDGPSKKFGGMEMHDAPQSSRSPRRVFRSDCAPPQSSGAARGKAGASGPWTPFSRFANCGCFANTRCLIRMKTQTTRQLFAKFWAQGHARGRDRQDPQHQPAHRLLLAGAAQAPEAQGIGEVLRVSFDGNVRN